jgi:RNA polymerase-binding transcription factor DksA
MLTGERRELMQREENAVSLTDETVNSGAFEVETGVIASEAGLLAECREALARIDGGTFGRCVHCGQTISRKRLKAVPYTRHCIDCAETAQKVAS